MHDPLKFLLFCIGYVLDDFLYGQRIQSVVPLPLHNRPNRSPNQDSKVKEPDIPIVPSDLIWQFDLLFLALMYHPLELSPLILKYLPTNQWLNVAMKEL